ncbi:MAG: hypothetical protein BRD40_04185, partial [Bacteroidetes bacterium QS_1_65_9]
RASSTFFAFLAAFAAALLLGAGEARAQFSPEKVISGPCSACDVAFVRTADLDDDGDQDVVVGSDFPYIGWFENTSSGFSDFKRINERALFSPISLADVNTDNKPEIFTTFGWYVNQGGGGFSEEKKTDGWSSEPVVGDVNGDGLKDVVTESLLGDIYLENPSFDPGAFGKADPAPLLDRPLQPDAVALADIGGDSKKDILTLGADTLGWLETGEESNEDGLRDFSELQGIEILNPNGNLSYREAFARDLDGDDDPDVLALLTDRGQPPSVKIVWYENTDGAGTFSDQKLIQGESRKISRTTLPFDVDADGDVDVVNFGGLALDRKGDSTVLQWYENDGGSYQAPKTLDGVEEIGRLSRGDLDGDGRADLLFAQEERGLVKWHPNLNDGTLGTQRAIGGDAPDFIHPVIGSLDEQELSVDVDQDNRRELLTRDEDGGRSLMLLENEGTGFAAPDTLSSFSQDDPFRGFEFFERIDGDSYPDWVYSVDDIPGWAENDGTGSFTYHRFGETPMNPKTTADVDGDGDRDLLSVYRQSKIYVNENVGEALQGGSSNRVGIDVNDGLQELVSANLDSDGDEDLLANFSTEWGEGNPAALVWYEDTGNNWDFAGGQDDFSDPVVIDESTAENGLPRYIEVADVDNDGDLDIINGLRWYENLDGDGTFSDPNAIDLYNPGVSHSHGFSLNIADVDGDGDPDVVFYRAPFGSTYQNLAREGGDWYGRRDVRWRENQGGTFASQEVLVEDLERPVLRGPRRPWITDISGDGVADIAYSSGKISWVNFQKIAWFENTEAIVERQSVASGETATFSEARTEIRLSSGTEGSGEVTVRRPFTGPVNTGSVATVFSDRLVIEADTGLTVGSDTKVRIDASSIAGIEDPNNVTVYRRDTTDRGTLEALPTSYDAEAEQMVATTDRFGEFVPATSTDQTPPDVPADLTAGVGADSVSLKWRSSDSTDVTEYRIYRATAPIDSSAGPAGLTALDTTVAPDTSYVDRSVQTGGLYYYRVTAVDDGLTPNESGFSGEEKAALSRPQVTGVRPASAAPGTRVRIYGANFDEKSTVRFGSATAPIDRVTPTVLYARVPEGPSGPVPVAVDRGIGSVEWSGQFSVLTGGKKTFGPVGTGLTGVSGGSLAWGDFDRDGDQDLAATGNNSDGAPTATIYENKGGGAFEPVGAGLTGVESGRADWGDYDGDGRLDLAVVGRDSDLNATATIYE